MHENSRLVLFYQNQALDDMGRSLEEIWLWDDDRLELVHDFIQWLFPLRERSGANPSAPVLSSEDIEIFRSDPVIQRNLNTSLERLLLFYGLDAHASDHKKDLVNSKIFLSKSRNWITPANHNYLRLTRILLCLNIVGLRDRAQHLFDMLSTIYPTYKHEIGERTFSFWSHAVRQS